jgi:integrase/recombinase XerD
VASPYIGADTARVIGAGPLRSIGTGFVSHLIEQGFEPCSLRSKLPVVAQLSRWMERRRLPLSRLDEARVREFLRSRRGRYRGVAAASATAFQLLRYAQGASGLSAVVQATGCEARVRLETTYREYLRRERALAEVTIDYYAALVRPLLLDPAVRAWRAREVTRFVLRRARELNPGRAKLFVTALRSFLRFLHVTGHIATELVSAVPTVAHWRHTALPRAIAARDVRRILDSCDRRTYRGRRDLAVLLLLSRLGLRAGEVARLSLEDLDWEAGEVRVRGKGPRLDRLPMPHDVGAALARYLRDRNASDGTRQVFVCSRAPRRAFRGPVAVSCLVHRAIVRAGLDPPNHGAHLLRHSLATDLLRRGATLGEIGDLLRHRSPDTTMIYAKVDLAALRGLARRWPGGAT